MSDFETGSRKLIPAVLVYARRGGSQLMIHRDGRPGDYHSGKWNGLGGKLEADESPLEAARREFREESGLSLPEEAFRAVGVLSFPNFKAAKSEDWVVYIFTARVPDDTGGERELASNDEGSLHWVALDKIPTLSLWAGDQYFLPFVATETPFMGTIWYSGQEVTRHWITTLSA